MGWSFRKSMNVGPFRVNASKSGVGFSLGKGPFRAGQSSRGRQYVSASIPGTGLRYDHTVRRGQAQSGVGGWIAAAGMFAWQYFFKGK
jgi:hypothetical protein